MYRGGPDERSEQELQEVFQDVQGLETQVGGGERDFRQVARGVRWVHPEFLPEVQQGPLWVQDRDEDVVTGEPEVVE